MTGTCCLAFVWGSRDVINWQWRYLIRTQMTAIIDIHMTSPSVPTPSGLPITGLALLTLSWPQFYQTRSAWSMDQGSTMKRSVVHNVVPTVTKFCVMWEGLSLPHDTKFGNCRGEIVDMGVVFIWSLIHGSSWSGLIKVGPGIKTGIASFYPRIALVAPSPGG